MLRRSTAEAWADTVSSSRTRVDRCACTRVQSRRFSLRPRAATRTCLDRRHSRHSRPALLGFHPDLVCVDEHGRNQVLRNRGDGTFAECARELGLDDPGEHGSGVVAFDAGTGEFGLCWGNTEGPHRLMVRRDQEAWLDCSTAGLAFPSVVRTVVAADFDNDGNDELFFNNAGEPNRVFRINASAPESAGLPGLTMLDAGEALDQDGFGTGAAVCDIDGDGVLERSSPAANSNPSLSAYSSRDRLKGTIGFAFGPSRVSAPRLAEQSCEPKLAAEIRVKGICGGSGYSCQMEPVAHFGFGRGVRAERVQVTWPDGSESLC